MSRGIFITFEGPEGSGKTTQLKRLAALLRKEKVPHLMTREPGGSKLSTHLRRWILDRLDYKLTPEAELHLFLADRAQHVREVLLPALGRGKVVLCDRYTDSTLAYQGGGRGFHLGLLEKMNDNVTGGLKPDLTLLFDVPVAVGLKRASQRARGKDRMEREERNFHQKVRRGFLGLARKHPRRFIVLSSTRSVEDVHGRMMEELRRRLPLGWKKRIFKADHD